MNQQHPCNKYWKQHKQLVDIQKRRNITLNIFSLFLEINTKYSNWVLVHVYFDKHPISHDKFSHVSVNNIYVYIYGREGRLHLPKVQRKDLRNCWTRPGLVHHIHLTQHKLARSFYFEFCNIYLLLCLASVSPTHFAFCKTINMGIYINIQSWSTPPD